MAENDVPRFRFAPSPTGPLHIGSLHTALFNWALARSMGGDFILRIDDTDAARNDDAHIDELTAALSWLGLDWDEGPDVGGPHGPYLQSQRRERHLQIAAQLYEQGAAYYGDEGQADRGPNAGAPLRLRVSNRDEAIIVEDALRGPIRFEPNQLSDPVIVRSDGSPLYHLATVVDDHDMAITHVARGEEWISSTPIHVQLYEQLAWRLPQWVHLPLILDQEGQKLSKRDARGGYLVRDFQQLGYLPQALFNYLLLLGWSPGQNEIVGKRDVRRRMRLPDLSTSAAMFDWEKLNWVNRHYLQQLSEGQLALLVRPYLEEAYPAARIDDRWLQRLVALWREEIVRLSDTVAASEWALDAQFAFKDEAEEALDSAAARPVLVRLIAELAQLVLLDEQTAQHALQSLQRHFEREEQWTAREVYLPIRAALTGRVEGPPLHEIMALLGKDACLQRVAAVLRR